MSQLSTGPNISSPRAARARAPGARLRHAVQEPLPLRAGEVGVQQQAGALAEERLQAAGAELLARPGGAPVLPDDRVGDGAARAVPDERRLALVGDADGGDVAGVGGRFRQRLAGGLDLGPPDRLRVVLHPAGARVYLLERLLGGGDGRAGAVEQDGAGGGRALVEGEDEVGHDAARLAFAVRRCRELTGSAGG